MFNFVPLINSPVAIGFSFLLLIIPTTISSKTINPICRGWIPHPPVNFFYHINLNDPINWIFIDFKFYRFINILAKFGRSSSGQFGARTILSKKFSSFFVLWSLEVFLSFNCLYLGLYYLKVVCTQFFVIYSKIDYVI